jgi:hypothetical protein
VALVAGIEREGASKSDAVCPTRSFTTKSLRHPPGSGSHQHPAAIQDDSFASFHLSYGPSRHRRQLCLDQSAASSSANTCSAMTASVNRSTKLWTYTLLEPDSTRLTKHRRRLTMKKKKVECLIVNLPTNHRYNTLQTMVSAMVSFLCPFQRLGFSIKYPFTARS